MKVKISEMQLRFYQNLIARDHFFYFIESIKTKKTETL
jgi:hypothetical protein